MSFRRVVVGIDFSERSLAAARWVSARLAPHAEIVLVHVLRRPEAPPFIQPFLEPMLDVVTEVAPALCGGLRGVADLIGVDRTAIDMREGSPADALAVAAVEADADLICVGRMQRRRGSARFGANTAQRLLARTRLPVLVVPETRPATPMRILAAVDDRPDTRTALAAAWKLACTRGARLDLLHVLGHELRAFVRACRRDRPHGAAIGRELELVTGSQQLRVRDETHLVGLTRDWMEATLAVVGAPVSRVGVQVRVGDPGQEIVAHAHASDIDLVILGRGGPPVDAAPGNDAPSLGSTARLVTWAAPCPVLVLPPPMAGTPPPPRPGRARSSRRRAANEPAPIASAECDGLPPAARIRGAQPAPEVA